SATVSSLSVQDDPAHIHRTGGSLRSKDQSPLTSAPASFLIFGFIVCLRVGLLGKRLILEPCKPGLGLPNELPQAHLNPVIYSPSQQYARTNDVLTQPNNFWFFIGHRKSESRAVQ